MLALYGRALGYGFIVDDHALIEHNAALQDWGTLPEALTHDLFHFSSVRTSPYWRPLVTLSYYVDQALGGGAPWAFHLSNLAALVLAGWGVSRLSPGWSGVLLGAAFIAHPLQVEGAVSVASRTDLFCVAFAAWALRAGPRTAAALTLGACLSKEVGLLVPLALLLSGRAWKPSAGVAAVVLGMRLLVPLGVPEGTPELLEAPGRIAWMTSRLVWPSFVGMSSVPESWSLALGLPVVAGLLLLGWRFRGPVALGLPALIAVSGVLGLSRGSDALLLLLLLALVWGLAPWSPRLRPMLVGVVLVGATLSGLRLRHWSDDLSLWTATLEAHPGDVQASLGVARAVVEEQPQRAFDQLEGVTGRTPREQREVHEVRARALLGADRVQEALAELSEAAWDDPEAAWANAQLCLLRPTVEVCERASRLSPDDDGVWNARGIVLAGSGKLAAAVQAFEQACSLGQDPAYCANAARARKDLDAGGP